MARKLPDEVHTLAEYQELIDIAVEIDEERYRTELNKVRSDATTQWNSEEQAKRERMIAELEANLAAEMIDGPNGPEPLHEAEYKQKWQAGLKEIDVQLAKEYNEYLQQAESMIEPAKDAKYYEDLYGFMKAGIEQQIEFEKEEEARKNVADSFSYDAYYILGNGQIYSVEAKDYVAARSVPPGAKFIKVNDTPDQFRVGVLEYYKNNGYPDVEIGFCLISLEECKAVQIAKVNAQVHTNIEAGFAYSLNLGRASETFYFSLYEDDQLNFGNMATAANLLIQNVRDEDISWQCWRTPARRTPDVSPVIIQFSPQKFLDLYMQGALKHINDCLDQGRKIKENIRKATTKDEVAALMVQPTAIAQKRR